MTDKSNLRAEYFVYALIEGMTSIRYVGYTGRLDQRQRYHQLKHPEWQLRVLDHCLNLEEAWTYEKKWIKQFHEMGHPLVNIREGGAGGYLGRKVSYLTKARLSESHMGNKSALGHRKSAETLVKMSEISRGKYFSPETRAKIAAATKKFWSSPEGQGKKSMAMKGKKNFLGHHHTDEARAKIAASSKARRHSAETRAKMSATRKGKPKSVEHRAKLSMARIGIPWSAVQRAAYKRRGKSR